MKISSRSIVFFLSCLVFVSVAHFLDLRMFNADLNDGFFSQIIFVANSLEGEVPLSPLFIIHFFRLLVVLPFYTSFSLGLSAWADALIFILYLCPLMASRHRSIFGYLPVLFLFFPILFSYRTVLGMFALTYLYVCLFSPKKEYRLFIASALLSILSSGIVLSWGICVAFSFSRLRKQYKFFDILFLVVILGFVGSLIHKYEFMFASQGVAEHGTAIERSTLFVAYIYEQYARFFFYFFLVLVIFLILIAGAYEKHFSLRRWSFFLASVPVMFFEGLGFISFLICIILFFANNIRFKGKVCFDR